MFETWEIFPLSRFSLGSYYGEGCDFPQGNERCPLETARLGDSCCLLTGMKTRAELQGPLQSCWHAGGAEPCPLHPSANLLLGRICFCFAFEMGVSACKLTLNLGAFMIVLPLPLKSWVYRHVSLIWTYLVYPYSLFRSLVLKGTPGEMDRTSVSLWMWPHT